MIYPGVRGVVGDEGGSWGRRIEAVAAAKLVQMELASFSALSSDCSSQCKSFKSKHIHLRKFYIPVSDTGTAFNSLLVLSCKEQNWHL